MRRDRGSTVRPPERASARGPDDTEKRLGNGHVLRVVVADSLRLLVAGIRRALEDDDEIEVAGEAHSERELLPLVARVRPDVVLVDLAMTKPDGFSVLEQLRARYPRVKVVVLSASAQPERVQAALSRGASGYIVKTVNPRDLPAALRQAVEGTVYHAIGVSEATEGHDARAAGLTERELTILKAVALGLSNQAIGRELSVTEQTVKFHLTNVYRKLGVANRTEAARYAYAHHFASAENDALESPS